jgi:heme oxygenase
VLAVDVAGRAGTARDALRAGSAHLHQEVEAALAVERLADPRLYARFLSCMGAVGAEVERATRDHLDPNVLAGLRDDLARIRADVAAMGDLGGRAPRVPELPVVDAAEALGALYVLEGARIGGRIVAKRVRAAGPSCRIGARYLDGDGTATGRRWRRFLQRLEAGLPDAERRARALRSTRRTFRLFLEARA